ncbi:XdhC family protein [[Clostridium] fimetarium]|uniref:Xanthine dehydrogenase accessory factor n=1 Tax=[Clostridium] fimetarium TaxID=99656 RepID=A0A1I0RAH7_9FIRM|nr:XdhC/CoxI family protein [[Clostridium] fimetarium]SEW37832.1 xanthine dehydrogenase accessory factor [[Clostridium] fimetarium]
MGNIYQTILNVVEQNQTILLATTLSSDRTKNTDRTGNTDILERRLVNESELLQEENQLFQEVLKVGKPVCIPDNSDKEHERFTLVEPFFPKERLVVLGGGHIALPLVEIASKVGFQVTVVDDRPSFANVPRFPTAEKVLCESFTSCLDQIKITRNDYIVIITRGHRHDADCLRQILKEPETIYVGMIGSKHRVAVVKQELSEEGFDEIRLERVCTPIGLAIGSATPEEISISIIAQLIKRKRLDRAEQFIINRSDMDSNMLNKLAALKNERCCMVTIIASKGSVPRGVGAKMIVYETGRIEGSIGGGCSESAIMRTALEIIGSKTWIIKDIDMTAEEAEEEGMVCGGIMTVLLEDMTIN